MTDHHHHHDHRCKKILTIRCHSGLSGDMLLTGLLALLDWNEQKINASLEAISPQLVGTLKRELRYVNHIRGWYSQISLPHEHAHRTLLDIVKIVEGSRMSEKGKQRAIAAFELLAQAEAHVHGKPTEEVHFHEVGALDSILDFCLACELFTALEPDELIVSPLPIADGAIHCAHGVIASPAPAVQQLLCGVPVCPFEGQGETVTPTAIALLKAFDASFGPWPPMKIEKIETAYGTKVFEGVANGALFALGSSYE